MRAIHSHGSSAHAARVREPSPTRFGRIRVTASITLTIGVLGTGVVAMAPPANASVFPIRAAFYYPWFPRHWTQAGIYPFTQYHPSLGYYDSSDPSVIKQHIQAMLYGNITLGIASWWGRGSYEDDHFPLLLNGAAGTSFKWAIYYENEGYSDPTSGDIKADLVYVRDHYSSDPGYLKINGKFVVFVYGGTETCSMPSRWKSANTVGAYIVLKIFYGYQNCSAQPQGWHQYAPAHREESVLPYSFTISPGFYKANESAPRLSRNLSTWKTNVQHMVNSRAQFQLISTFNEWGEGSSVESAKEWCSPWTRNVPRTRDNAPRVTRAPDGPIEWCLPTAYGTYLMALHDN